MQMYQPAQRLARGNAEQRNGRKWSTVCGHCNDDDHGSGSQDYEELWLYCQAQTVRKNIIAEQNITFAL